MELDLSKLSPAQLESLVHDNKTMMEVSLQDLTMISQGLRLYKIDIMARTEKLINEANDKEDRDFLITIASAKKVMDGLDSMWLKLCVAREEVQNQAEKMLGCTFESLRTSSSQADEYTNIASKILDCASQRMDEVEKEKHRPKWGDVGNN